MENWKTWLRVAGIRAVKTIAQTELATLGLDMVGVANVDLKLSIALSIMSGILSLLTSLKGLPEIKLETEIENLKESEK